jgi:Flp pilus assembly protein TadG
LDIRDNIRGRKVPTHGGGKPARRDRGVETVEFALVLPLLLIMLLGVLFYGGAWQTKEKTDGAARDGARVAVSVFNDTTNPQCGGGTPCSVQAAANAVVSALSLTNVDTCGLTPSTTAPALSGTFAWTYTSPACASSGQPYTIVVEREVSVATTVTSSGTTSAAVAPCTRVTVNYPYAWNIVAINPFGNVVQLSSASIMTNLN